MSQIYQFNGTPYYWAGQPQYVMGHYLGPNTQADYDRMVQRGMIKPLAPQQSSNSAFNTASISRDFTPNQYTARQLAELQSGSMGGGGNTIPAWMHNAFANKMGRMGAPTTEPFPYQITGSSFRGMPAGKAAPTGGQ